MSLLLSEVDEGASTIWAEPFAIDDSGVEPTLVQTHSPGAKFPLGDTTVIYTYSDQADNQANCSFVVTVQSGTLICLQNPACSWRFSLNSYYLFCDNLEGHGFID